MAKACHGVKRSIDVLETTGVHAQRLACPFRDLVHALAEVDTLGREDSVLVARVHLVFLRQGEVRRQRVALHAAGPHRLDDGVDVTQALANARLARARKTPRVLPIVSGQTTYHKRPPNAVLLGRNAPRKDMALRQTTAPEDCHHVTGTFHVYQEDSRREPTGVAYALPWSKPGPILYRMRCATTA